MRHLDIVHFFEVFSLVFYKICETATHLLLDVCYIYIYLYILDIQAYITLDWNKIVLRDGERPFIYNILSLMHQTWLMIDYISLLSILYHTWSALLSDKTDYNICLPSDVADFDMSYIRLDWWHDQSSFRNDWLHHQSTIWHTCLASGLNDYAVSLLSEVNDYKISPPSDMIANMSFIRLDWWHYQPSFKNDRLHHRFYHQTWLKICPTSDITDYVISVLSEVIDYIISLSSNMTDYIISLLLNTTDYIISLPFRHNW